MAFPARNRRRRNNLIKAALALAVAIAAIVFIGRLNSDEEEPVRVLGTRGGFYEDEEIGVVDDAASGDVVTMPAPDAEAPPLARTEPQPRPAPASPRAPAPTPAPARAPVPVSREAASASANALPKYREALTRKPTDPLLLNNYGWNLHLAGRYDEAETTLREVIRIAPSRAIAYANLGETLWKQGRNEEAAAMYRRFLDLNTQPRREAIAQRKLDQITGGGSAQ